METSNGENFMACVIHLLNGITLLSTRRIIITRHSYYALYAEERLATGI